MTRFLLRILLLAAIVFPLQIAAGNLIEDHGFPSRLRLDEILADRADTVALGDSTMRWTNPEEPDKRTLADFLQDALPTRRLRLLQGDGSRLLVYEYHVRYLAESPAKPRDIILPINLRSFSPIWDEKPGFQARIEILRFRWGDTFALGLLRPMATFGIYKLNPISLSEWGELPLYRGDRYYATLSEALLGEGPWAKLPLIERTFVANYMNPIRSDHRLLGSLTRLIQECHERGVHLLLYLTPIDLESGLQSAGEDLRTQVRKNVAVIQATAKNAGEEILDLTEILRAGDFDWARTQKPNEHLLERGRRIVAQRVAQELARRTRS
jgi:hypothetical protein